MSQAEDPTTKTVSRDRTPAYSPSSHSLVSSSPKAQRHHVAKAEMRAQMGKAAMCENQAKRSVPLACKLACAAQSRLDVDVAIGAEHARPRVRIRVSDRVHVRVCSGAPVLMVGCVVCVLRRLD